jgi:hypothetical protein
MAVGDEFASGAIPLHVTVLSNVRLDDSAVPGLLDVFAQIASGTPLIESEAGDLAMFGPNNDVLVTLVRVTPALRDLHLRLLSAAHEAGATSVEPAYDADGYRAHVTHTSSGEAVPLRDRVTLTEIVTLDCTDRVRRVLSMAALGS